MGSCLSCSLTYQKHSEQKTFAEHASTLWENSVPEDHKILLRYAARKTWQKCIDHVQDLSDKSHVLPEQKLEGNHFIIKGKVASPLRSHLVKTSNGRAGAGTY